MMLKSVKYLFLFFSLSSFGQDIDTLSFYSEAFKTNRTVFVHKPEYYKYKSDSVKLPVIYLLDGQHEWFVNPILSDILYLQYTHEIPNALVVVVPHVNRNEECGIQDINVQLPLDKFLTEELDKELQIYNPGSFKVIIGHSFSASFSLYSFLRHPDYYSAVLSNSPLDEFETLIGAFLQNDAVDLKKIYLSIGGSANDKDYHHRKKYDWLKTQYPLFFSTVNSFEANNSAHNAVPLVATPFFLTKVFYEFSSRYSGIAEVDEEYKLRAVPLSVNEEINKISEASGIGDFRYSPEIPELNGIASRYEYNGYSDYAKKVYEIGIECYPNYYEFYLFLYELEAGTDAEQAKLYLNKAEQLLKTVESDWEGKDDLLNDIQLEKMNNGW